MVYTITEKNMPKIELFPEDETQEILQNICCMLTTIQGSCPHLRGYGVDPDLMHQPVNVVKAAYTVAIVNQFQQFEDRATLQSISYEDDPEHPEILHPVLEVYVREE